MSPTLECNFNQVVRGLPCNAVGHPQGFARILFFHHSAAELDLCLHELNSMRFSTSSEAVLTGELPAERLRVGNFHEAAKTAAYARTLRKRELDLFRQFGSAYLRRRWQRLRRRCDVVRSGAITRTRVAGKKMTQPWSTAWQPC
jgi:hypothetical protein